MRVHHDVSHYTPAFALGAGQPCGRQCRQPDIGGRAHAPLRAHSPRSHVKLALVAVSGGLHSRPSSGPTAPNGITMADQDARPEQGESPGPSPPLFSPNLTEPAPQGLWAVPFGTH